MADESTRVAPERNRDLSGRGRAPGGGGPSPYTHGGPHRRAPSRPRPVWAGAAWIVAVISLAACTERGPVDPAALVGTYDLISIELQGRPAARPPSATGTMQLTTATYVLDVRIIQAGQPDELIQDQGSYTASGTQWTQTSSVTSATSIGIFDLSGEFLTVDISSGGARTVTTWRQI